MRFLHFFIYFLGCFGIIATALPFIKIDFWLIRIFSFPRVQIAVLCLLAIVLFLIFLKLKKIFNMVLLSLLGAAFIYQVVLVVPYTPFYRLQALPAKPTVDKNNFSIMEANILMSNKKVEAFIDNVEQHNPDLLLLLEPNSWWALRLRELDKEYPYSIKYPLENTYGMMLFSKFPLKEAEINFIVEEDIPSFYARVVLPSGEKFDLYCIHPKPPTASTSKYPMDTELMRIGKMVKKRGRPAIVMGDFNDVSWSFTVGLFQEYTNLLDPRQGRGLYNTFDAHVPLWRYPLDHFFYSKQFGLLEFERLGNTGSDHFALYIKLHFDPKMDYSNSEWDLDDRVENEVEEVLD
ncbi:MAG TPA: endonuclease/exonuclease/phosphatase family protein [Salinimicrobium sp.]|nr:endonuclease/exonuclease/phosphatase family protein [Salinimicrobium sp.]